MGTQGVHMKGVLPSLVCWASRAGTTDFCRTLTALVNPVQNIFFLTVQAWLAVVPRRRFGSPHPPPPLRVCLHSTLDAKGGATFPCRCGGGAHYDDWKERLALYSASSESEFVNILNCPGYIGWRNRFIGIDSWAP